MEIKEWDYKKEQTSVLVWDCLTEGDNAFWW
jgi:hypothetical protein